MIDSLTGTGFIKQYLEEHGYDVPMSSILHGYERAKKFNPDFGSKNNQGL